MRASRDWRRSLAITALTVVLPWGFICAQSIVTFAGGGVIGDGAAAVTPLYDPRDIAVGPSGDLYIADGLRIVRVSAATGALKTVAGNGAVGEPIFGVPATKSSLSPIAVEVDDDSNLYIILGSAYFGGTTGGSYVRVDNSGAAEPAEHGRCGFLGQRLCRRHTQ